MRLVDFSAFDFQLFRNLHEKNRAYLERSIHSLHVYCQAQRLVFQGSSLGESTFCISMMLPFAVSDVPVFMTAKAGAEERFGSVHASPDCLGFNIARSDLISKKWRDSSLKSCRLCMGFLEDARRAQKRAKLEVSSPTLTELLAIDRVAGRILNFLAKGEVPDLVQLVIKAPAIQSSATFEALYDSVAKTYSPLRPLPRILTDSRAHPAAFPRLRRQGSSILAPTNVIGEVKLRMFCRWRGAFFPTELGFADRTLRQRFDPVATSCSLKTLCLEGDIDWVFSKFQRQGPLFTVLGRFMASETYRTYVLPLNSEGLFPQWVSSLRTRCLFSPFIDASSEDILWRACRRYSAKCRDSVEELQRRGFWDAEIQKYMDDLFLSCRRLVSESIRGSFDDPDSSQFPVVDFLELLGNEMAFVESD